MDWGLLAEGLSLWRPVWMLKKVPSWSLTFDLFSLGRLLKRRFQSGSASFQRPMLNKKIC